MNLASWRKRPARSRTTASELVPTSSAYENDPERIRLQKEVDAIPMWFHSLDLGHGVVTPGFKTRELLHKEMALLELPDLRGKSVLDIGAWDGAYSFEAERRGARRVVSLDHYVWSVDFSRVAAYREESARQGRPPSEWKESPDTWRPDTLPGKRGFDLARRALGSKVEFVVGDFMDMDLSTIGTFDVTFFLGVLYHLRHPLLGLERLASVTSGVAVIETAGIAMRQHDDLALCEFYETTELKGDPTNWWAPNRKALEGMCRAAGFERVEVRESRRGRRAIKRTRLYALAYK